MVRLKPGMEVAARACTGYRCIDAGPEANGAKIERIDWVYGRGGLRFRDAHDIVVRDAVLRLRNPQTGSNLPVGIDIRSGSRIRIERVTANGHQMVEQPKRYTNGDGFSTERLASDVTFTDTIANDNSDGGYDLKSTGTRLRSTKAARNGRNYRFWGQGNGETIFSASPRGAHIWAGKTSLWSIDRLVATGGGVLVQAEPGARLTIRSCDLRGWNGDRLIAGATAGVKLGKGCRP